MLVFRSACSINADSAPPITPLPHPPILRPPPSRNRASSARLSIGSLELGHSLVIGNWSLGIMTALHPRNTPPVLSTNYQLPAINFPNQTKPPRNPKIPSPASKTPFRHL